MKRSKIRSSAMWVACATLSLGAADAVRACDHTDTATAATAGGVMALMAATDEPTPQAPEAQQAPRAPRPPRVYVRVPNATPAAPAAPAPPLDMAPSRVLPRGWFGFGLQCNECGAKREPGDSIAVWTFGDQPRVYLVSDGSPAARAGFMRGDIITQIDGVPIESEEGGRMFGLTRPGQTVRWTVQREGQWKIVSAIAEERPERRARQKAVDDLRESLKRMNYMSDLATMRLEIERLNQRINQLNMVGLETPAPAPRPPAQRRQAPRQLRWAGVVGSVTEVEVRGNTPAIVSQSDDKSEVVINIGESVVVIRVPEGTRVAAEKKKDR